MNQNDIKISGSEHSEYGSVNVVILAGAPADDGMTAESGYTSRAMVGIAGKTMLQWVVDALRGANCIGKIAAVGDVQADGLDYILPPGGDLVTNIKRGVEMLHSDDLVLISTSDIPLLTSEGVDDFVDRASKLGVDLAYPIISKSACEEKYPGLHRTYVITADGIFTGGNMMLATPGFLSNNWEVISQAYAARKHPARLARMIGWSTLARVLLGQLIPGVLKIDRLENAISRILNAKMAAVISDYPEIGEDVDKLSDLQAVRKILS